MGCCAICLQLTKFSSLHTHTSTYRGSGSHWTCRWCAEWNQWGRDGDQRKNKRAIHSSSTFCTSARIWCLRKLLKEGVKLYAKQQIVPRLFHLKKSRSLTWVKSRLFFCADCLMRFQCLLNVPVTHSAAMHSFNRFARKSDHTGLMISPLYDRLMTPCYIDLERSGMY